MILGFVCFSTTLTLMVSCGGDVTGNTGNTVDTNALLTGIWVITTTPILPDKDIGTITMMLAFDEQLSDFYFWEGSCSVSSSIDIDGTYLATGYVWAILSNQYMVSIVGDVDSDSDGENDQIDFVITSEYGSTMTGNYEGELLLGPFAVRSGSFTMIKQ